MEQSKQVLGKTKKIKDATLMGKKTETAIQERFKPEKDDTLLEGEQLPPLELTDELQRELVEKEKEKEKEREKIRAKTKHYTNGVNEWQLIAKTYNDFLGYEHVTTAMQAGRGVLICVKEAIDQKMTSTVTYAPNMILYKATDELWHIVSRD